MNRQYFGDTRDLFKFDLVRHIMKYLPDLSGFTYVPMMTETGNKGGQKKNTKKDLGRAYASGKAGTQNRDLSTLLEQLQEIESALEYVTGISSYFEHERIATEIFHKTRFTHENREHYFQNLLVHFPARSLVFFDPDTGLKERSPGDKYLLFSEVKTIHETMDTGSILMIYQHFPRVKRGAYIRNRCSQLATLTGSIPVAITDNEIIFFLITKNPKLKERMKNCIGSYADSYPDLNSCSCEQK
jgi:hypothetical protein